MLMLWCEVLLVDVWCGVMVLSGEWTTSYRIPPRLFVNLFSPSAQVRPLYWQLHCASLRTAWNRHWDSVFDRVRSCSCSLGCYRRDRPRFLLLDPARLQLYTSSRIRLGESCSATHTFASTSTPCSPPRGDVSSTCATVPLESCNWQLMKREQKSGQPRRWWPSSPRSSPRPPRC